MLKIAFIVQLDTIVMILRFSTIEIGRVPKDISALMVL